MVVGLCLCGVAMIGLVRLRTDTPLSAIWWDLLAVGFGGGLHRAVLVSGGCLLLAALLASALIPSGRLSRV